MQRRTRVGIILLLSAAIPIFVVAFSTGPPAAHTGAPFPPDNGKTCTVCHIGTVNSGSGNVRITAAPATYTSGGTFPITVTVSDPNARRWGFELSARTQGGQQAGTLILGSDGFTQFMNEGGIQYIEHTLTGTRGGMAGPVNFNFQWQAPNISAGPVTFFVAGNAANNNLSDSGDRIYTSSATVQPQAPPPPPPNPPPSVSENGTVNNASFVAGTNPLAPGTIAAIFGTNLNDGSSLPDSSFGSDGKLLTTLGGASVTFNGISASLFSSFPTQLNVQMPLELAGSTSASVQVTVGGQASTPRAVPIGSSSPGIFTIPPGGTGQGAVKISNRAIFAAPTGSISGAQAQPANRGEFITIFCTGLGSVTNPPATGRPASSSPLSTTIATAQVTIGGVPATVNFSGLSPGFVGLYQVDVQVPAAAPTGNAVTVAMSIGGVAANPVTIAVAP